MSIRRDNTVSTYMSTTSGSVSPPLPSEAEAAPTSSAGTVPLAAGAAVAAEAVLGSTGAAGAAEAVEAAEEVLLAVPLVAAPESGEHNRRPLGKGSESMAGLWAIGVLRIGGTSCELWSQMIRKDMYASETWS